MQITILVTGKCREKKMLALEKEYLGRLPASWRATVRELPDAETPEAEAGAQLTALDGLPVPNVKILLDERGEQVGSRQLAAKFEGWQGQGIKAVALLIGGANGIADKVKTRGDWVMGFGKLTMPHQLVRVVLAEQVYRVHTIISGHPYHRD